MSATAWTWVSIGVTFLALAVFAAGAAVQSIPGVLVSIPIAWLAVWIKWRWQDEFRRELTDEDHHVPD